jgi:predicted RND superfamily exporter protein
VQALRDFSLLGSLGLTGAFAAALTLLPALAAIFSKNKNSTLGTLRPIFANPNFLHWLATHRIILIGLGASLFITAGVILCLPGKWISLDPDLSAMNPEPNPPLDAEKIIQQRMGASAEGMICYLRANTSDDLVHLAQQTGNRLRETTGISGTFGLDSLLPDPLVAKERLKSLDPKLADRVIADFNAALNANGFKIATFTPYADFLRKLITNRTPPDLTTLLQYPSLAETILPANSFNNPQPPTEAVTYVFTEANSPQSESSIESIRASLKNIPDATLTGLGVLSHDAETNVARQLPRLICIAMCAIAIYLLIHFRNLTDLILSLLPTVFSLACVLAFDRLYGTRLDIVNLVAFPLLIGIDVDYGVFLVSAARQKRRSVMDQDELLASITPSFSAVILCATATILGFASLLFTSIPAVHSLGLLVSLGILTCGAAIALFCIPAMFMGW